MIALYALFFHIFIFSSSVYGSLLVLFLLFLLLGTVHHGAELLEVDLARPVLVELEEGRLPLLRRQVRTDLLKLRPGDESVAVLVDGLEGQLGAGLVAAELLEGHLAVHVLVAVTEDLHHLGPEQQQERRKMGK